MKKRILKIAIAAFITTLTVRLIIETPYYKALRDDISTSAPKNVTMEAIVNGAELRISYKWNGFKEYYTSTDYIILQYNNDIEFDYKGMNASKEFYNSIRYLQGDFSMLSSLIPKKELVIPIDRSSREGEVIIPIEEGNDKIEDITVYYAHEVSLPMDIPTGWISKKVEKINSLPK